MGCSNICMHINFLPAFLLLLSFYSDFTAALDTIIGSQNIKDPKTISSNDSAFKLGFFSPENSTNRYVGIWYLSESNVIWVANRDKALVDSSGIVAISKVGNLVVLNGQKEVLWSSDVPKIATNSSAKLLNSGNLVLLDANTGNMIWQSFEHPSNTFLPNLVLSANKITGEKVQITSWKSLSDPSIGNFSGSIERLSVPEVFIWNHTQPYWRSGPWNGQVFIGINHMYTTVYLNGFSVGREENGTVHISYSVPNESFYGTIVLNPDGKMVHTTWMNKQKVGKRIIQENQCDIYGFCGVFGSCDPNDSPICSCLRGFKPKNVDEWDKKDWAGGCRRTVPLQCERSKDGSKDGKEDGFLMLKKTKVPDFAERSSVSEETCRTQCLNNCSCTAYAYDAGIGCLSWSGKLIDIVRFAVGGIDLYVREAYSEIDGERYIAAIVAVTVTIGAIMIVVCFHFLWAWNAKSSARRTERRESLFPNAAETHRENQSANLIGNLKHIKLEELPPLFDFRNIATATNNFNLANRLGKGGFGSVYKGELQDGQEIAVKRLSRASGQGLEEFMNEVIVISKLQHRNLVRLLGCCIEEDEKMLIYEYMPNKSLDSFVFDPHKKKILDWQKRFNIIEGIARGLLYLHRDSRLRIIHRDLKPSNILLDEDLNPKISDFGMARIFGVSEDVANTRRVVGTYGYMAPEYAIEGLFSEKSDVFSFGVILLEIVIGRKNTSFYYDEQSLSLTGFIWKLWNEDNFISLIDEEIRDPEFGKGILRCLHIGLLCVQELARERPTMATVVSMLNSEIVNLPSPTQPAFILRQTSSAAESSQSSDKICSINNVSITNIQGR